MKQKVYAIEDDPAIQELYTYTLENDFDCRVFSDGKSFFQKLAASQNEKPDLILLDIMLPGEDGFGLLARLKADRDFAHIPVIMVSAKGEEISKVKGLNMGADDYIAKPFGVLELVARVKANLRKNSTLSENISFKDIAIEPSKHRVTANGKQLQTTLKEYNLLLLLCENAERVQERDAIFRAVWGGDFVGETRTLDIHVKELRRKLAEAGSAAAIETVRGVGYMLV